LDDTLTTRLAERLKRLRRERGWPLDRLAAASGVSRATLSRLENAEVSPTTEVLGKLCSAYALTLSRLISEVEEGFPPVVRRGEQALWSDKRSGFHRRTVSPPAGALAAEILECELKPGARLAYCAPSVPGMQHHLYLVKGYLEVTVEGKLHKLKAGDCLRYRLFGATEFRTVKTRSAKYILVLV